MSQNKQSAEEVQNDFAGALQAIGDACYSLEASEAKLETVGLSSDASHNIASMKWAFAVFKKIYKLQYADQWEEHVNPLGR